MTTTTTIPLDRRLLAGLSISPDTIAAVAHAHLSVLDPCGRCGVTFCPSWRVAAPLLRRRSAEVRNVDPALVAAARKSIPPPASPTSAPPDVELFDATQYRVEKPRRRRAP